MDLGIALVNGIANNFLDTLRSGPGLTAIQMIDVNVCPKERIENASLVFLNELIIRWEPVKAWEISAEKDHA